MALMKSVPTFIASYPDSAIPGGQNRVDLHAHSLAGEKGNNSNVTETINAVGGRGRKITSPRCPHSAALLRPSIQPTVSLLAQVYSTAQGAALEQTCSGRDVPTQFLHRVPCLILKDTYAGFSSHLGANEAIFLHGCLAYGGTLPTTNSGMGIVAEERECTAARDL